MYPPKNYFQQLENVICKCHLQKMLLPFSLMVWFLGIYPEIINDQTVIKDFLYTRIFLQHYNYLL